MTSWVTWRGRIKVLVVLAVVTAGLAMPEGGATPIAHAADLVIEVDSSCTLVQAINDANSVTGPFACSNHDANANVIQLVTTGDTVPLPGTSEQVPGVSVDLLGAPPALAGGARTALPPITVPVTIEGDGNPLMGIYAIPLGPPTCVTVTLPNQPPSTVCSNDPTKPQGARLFHVTSTGSLTLRALTLVGGDITGVRGSMVCAVRTCGPVAGTDVRGGAIYAEGALALDNVTIADSVAHGGDGARGEWFNAMTATWDKVLAPGGTAWGGAVYAAGAFSATQVLFRNTRVIGGTEGGAARGGAIAFPSGSTTDAVVTNSVFEHVSAQGGNGTAGENGDDGANGGTGAAGRCLANDWSAADGANGGDGADGEAGGDGGNGGDAIGVISGGRNVQVDHSAVIGAVAVAGTAGLGGLGGVGGDGGNGGLGRGCEATAGYHSIVTWSGFGGDGGQPGDNGRIGTPGNRGIAAATFDIPGRLDLVDVTIADASATVPDDLFPTGPGDRYPTGMTTTQYNAARDRALSTVSHSGAAGVGPAGPGTAPAKAGSIDTTIDIREFRSSVGAALAFQSSSTMKAKISYTTIGDTVVTIPSSTNHRSGPTQRALTLATGAIGLVGRVAGMRAPSSGVRRACRVPTSAPTARTWTTGSACRRTSTPPTASRTVVPSPRTSRRSAVWCVLASAPPTPRCGCPCSCCRTAASRSTSATRN